MSARVSLIIGRFHEDEADAMQEEAFIAARECGLEIADTVWIPGSMEAPLAAKRALVRDQTDGVVVLGIIERGETGHGLVMAQAVVAALISLQIETMKPIGVGILGPEIFPSQIGHRVRPYARNAVLALSHMLKMS